MSPNRSSATGISKLGVGFVSFDPTYNLFTSMSIDRVSILGGQRGAFKGPGIDQAPDTPTGLTVNPSQTSASVFANSVPNATGYRFYRRTPGVSGTA